MKRDCDTIVFDELSEVECLLDVIAKYVKQNPKEKNNKTLERFYSLLELLEITW